MDVKQGNGESAAAGGRRRRRDGTDDAPTGGRREEDGSAPARDRRTQRAENAGEARDRRTQAERSQATRAALIGAARRLFASRGYSAVGTEEIVRAAGVTRGALYHHFADKRDLFRAVYEQVEAQTAERIAAGIPAGAGAVETLAKGSEIFLDACLEPELQQIALLDAPAVLGWEEWRRIGTRYGLGLIEAVLRAGIESGELRPGPVRPLAHALLGALDEIAMLVARADDPRAARAEAGEAHDVLLAALRAPG